MDLYAENILDHYRHPRGKTLLPSPTVDHEEINVSCGDALRLQLLLQGDRIEQVGWAGTGCAISQAAMSMLAEDMANRSAPDLDRMRKEDIYSLLGVPIGLRRTKCALLALHTLKNALRKARGEAAQGWLETVDISE